MINKKLFLPTILIFSVLLLFSTAIYASPSLSLIYVIQQGDTLSEIAADYGIGLERLKAENKIINEASIKMGDELVIPQPKTAVKDSNQQDRKIFSNFKSEKETVSFSINTHYAARINPGHQAPNIDKIPKNKIIDYYVGPGDTLYQVAVAAVIINRVLSRKFPNTFAQVIYQGGQFSAVSDGQINLTPNQTAYRAARDALNGSDPTNGALYFYNPKTATRVSFFRGRRVITKIGDHVFIE